MPIYHYGEKRSLALNYSFVEDLSAHSDLQLQRQLPTLILHGKQDDVIGIESSQNYSASRPWVQLIEVESDHALTDVLPELWQEVHKFCF
jgi:pimeloyl-ACP methyl ester carboxylesterase